MTAEVAVRDKLSELDRHVLSLIEEQEENGSDIAEAIAAAYLDATNVEDVLGGGTGTVAAEDVLGVELTLRGVRWIRSDFDGPGYAAIMECVKTMTGEPVVVSCGARQVMVQLWKLIQLGALPVVVVIHEVGKAKQGRSAPLGLRAAAP
jgi:hypothetical protein